VTGGDVTETILSVEQVAERTPWSKSTLYREAPKEDSPFHKVGGRWVTTEADLLEWVRRGPKPQRARAENPMPRRRRRDEGDFMAEVIRLREEAA
jgi:excisionase family DNA binding protein